MESDYLILGSGLSALTFAALAAKSGASVVVLEAHELPGGYGHTFVEKNKLKEYHFNAQFHYVWDCGPGEPVHQVLQKLGLEKKLTFVKYCEDGFDHMYIPGYTLKIPNSYTLLCERLMALFPESSHNLKRFIFFIRRIAGLMKDYTRFSARKSNWQHKIKHIKIIELLRYTKATLQDIFNKFDLPLNAQALLASQWPDFMLPPNQLSFYCWLGLFDGYICGAYYPEQHFEQVIQSLIEVIEQHGGKIIYNQTVTEFKMQNRKITAVKARNTLNPTLLTTYTGKNVICNFDPKQAAQMIGLQHFSKRLIKQLSYTYSYSNFMVYGSVKGIDLRDYGFGNWNVFHSEQSDINTVFNEMYEQGDYEKPSFVITTPSLVSNDTTGCPPGEQLFELLTVANYSLFKHLKLRNNKDYNQFKMKIYNKMVDIISRDYIPNFRDYITFKMLGSPTTNESYCWAPEGNSYGANMTPANTGINKLSFDTSLDNFYFCNASAGFAGFAKSFSNGALLYEKLIRDTVLSIG